MKQTLLCLAFALLTIPMFGQRQNPSKTLPYSGMSADVPSLHPVEKMLMSPKTTQLKLWGYSSSDGYEMTDYSYENDKLIAIYMETTGIDSFRYYDSIRYNEAGQLVRIDGHQFLNGTWQHVNYIEYTYNEQGLRATRTNYNNLGGWNLGGVYSYTYNEAGQITQSELIFAGGVYSRTYYTYADGKLTSERWQQYDYEINNVIDAQYFEYHYVGEKLDSVAEFAYSNGVPVYSGAQKYTYDAAGNCSEYQKRDAAGEVIERRIYDYGEELLSDTQMPWTPEINRPYTYTNHNIYHTEHWWITDANGVLQYVCDYNYDYTEPVGIEEAAAAAVACYPNPAADVITIDAPEGEPVRVFDAMGRPVVSCISTGRMQVALPHSGLYLVRVGNVSYKVIRK